MNWIQGLFRIKSIKKALLLKIGMVAIIPLVTISAFNYLYYRSDSMKTTADIQSLVNQNTATKIHLYIMAQQLLFMEYSKHSPVVRPKDPPEKALKRFSAFLGRLSGLTMFNHLMVVDHDGMVISHLSRDPDEPESLKGRILVQFRPPISYLMSDYGRYTLGRYSFFGQYAAIPLVKSSSRKRVYMVGMTKLETLKAFMDEELSILESKNLTAGTMMLVDEKSNRIVMKSSKQRVTPWEVDWANLNSKNRKVVQAKKVWYGDKEAILVGNNAFHLGTLVTKNDILFNSTRMLNVTIGMVLIGLCMIAWVAIFIANGYVKPLRDIGAKLSRVAQGDYEGQIEVLTQDEFGQLGEAANQMTKDLKRSSEQIQRHLRSIKKEKKRSERLLLNILPASIADRLKKEEKIIADEFEIATILFSDIVGFTQFSQTLTAHQLVERLNSLYSRFDDLLDDYPIEKIKTIGDALMLVSGVPVPVKDHAAHMVKMALAMYGALADFNDEYGLSLGLRIGLHSGPVVAGVIGKKKFVYDLWGDSVNTASRMESHGVPGEVHMSSATYQLVKGKFEIKARGKIEVKGKGKMATYLLKPSGF